MGIFPPLAERIRNKRERAAAFYARAVAAAEAFWEELDRPGS